jgi:hypothetical protein
MVELSSVAIETRSIILQDWRLFHSLAVGFLFSIRLSIRRDVRASST